MVGTVVHLLVIVGEVLLLLVFAVALIALVLVLVLVAEVIIYGANLH